MGHIWQSICDEVKKKDEEHWREKKKKKHLEEHYWEHVREQNPKVKNLKFLHKVHTQKRVKTKHVLLIIFHPIGWLEIDFLIMFYTLVTWAKSMISNNRHINMHYMSNIET